MKHAFEKAVITSINKTTGRVGLFLRNGLETYGVYLYDLNDLYVGMTVLVGLMNGAYVIFQNMSSNAPVVATKSYSNPNAFAGEGTVHIASIECEESEDWTDDFTGDEYGNDDIDTNKWEIQTSCPFEKYYGGSGLSADQKPAFDRVYARVRNETYANMPYGDTTYLTQFKGGLHYTEYDDIRLYDYYFGKCVAMLSVATIPGDFHVVVKVVLIKLNDGTQQGYPAGTDGWLNLEYSYSTSIGAYYESDYYIGMDEIFKDHTLFIKIQRESDIWSILMKVAEEDDWILFQTISDVNCPHYDARLLLGFRNYDIYYNTPTFYSGHSYAQALTIGVISDNYPRTMGPPAHPYDLAAFVNLWCGKNTNNTAH